jgi:type II secretory pathway component PulK
VRRDIRTNAVLKTRIDNRNSRRGIALMIVMLVVFVLTGMVAAFALKMKVELQLAKNDNNETQLEWEARGAVEWAKFAITHKCPNMQNIDTLNDPWAGGIGCPDDPVLAQVDLHNIQFISVDGKSLGSASVKITDMERKWNINALANPKGPQPAVIQNALAVMGITDPSLQANITDCILDWVDPRDKARFNGAKNDYYLHLDPPYYCKCGFIDDISELLRIKGITPEMVSATNFSMSAYQKNVSPFSRDWVPPSYDYHFDELFTVFGAKLNANTASREALMLIPGIDAEIADNIVRGRNGEDGVAGTEDDTPYRSPAEVMTRGISGAPMGGPGGMPGFGAGAGFGAAQGMGRPGVGGTGVGGPPMGGPGMLGMAQRFLDVSSKYFEVTIDAAVGDYHRTYYAILYKRVAGKDPLIVKFYCN